MASYNKVILMGNLTRDPELRVTPKGTSVCQIGLAVNRTYRDSDGNNREDVTFVDVDAFGKQAEVLAKYMNKGRPILVEGRLQLDSWESKTGEKRNKLKVILEGFQFVGSRSDGGDSSYENVSPPSRKSDMGNAAASSESVDEPDIDDDVPF